MLKLFVSYAHETIRIVNDNGRWYSVPTRINGWQERRSIPEKNPEYVKWTLDEIDTTKACYAVHARWLGIPGH